jgi:hypothetical protein
VEVSSGRNDHNQPSFAPLDPTWTPRQMTAGRAEAIEKSGA